MKTSNSRILALIITVIMVFLYCFLMKHQKFSSADYYIFDWQSKRLASKLVSDENIIVVAIDDKSLTEMNAIAGRWVWPRSIHAELIESFIHINHQAIVFDILFAEKDIYRPDADSYFNEVIGQSSMVFFPMLQLNTLPSQTQHSGILLNSLSTQLDLIKTPLAQESSRASMLLPNAVKQEYWQVGSINFTSGNDGVGRFYDVYRNIDGWQLPSLPAKVVSTLGMKTTEQARVLLQWRGDPIQPFTTLSYVDVFRAIQLNDINYLQQFTNKIIIIGATASGLFDARVTPLNKELAGVYMLATAIDNLKNQRFLHSVSDTVEVTTGIILICFISSFFVFIQRYSLQVLLSFVSLVLACGALIFISEYLLYQQVALLIGRILVFMAASFILCCLIYGYLEYINRQKALAVFGRFLDPQVVMKLLAEKKLTAGQLNKKQMVTVLFSDIRNFTQLSEKHAAEDIVSLLNRYFSEQVNIIFQQKGTLDKFIGDCIMAFWGAPLSNKNHAVDAINAALAMEEQLLTFRQSLPAEMQQFDVGIGIHSGEAVVGLIGAELRSDYTVIGDTVNLSSRIEGLTKNHCRILISEQTKILAEHAFDFIYFGEHEVKGKQEKVKLFQPKRKI